MKNIKFIHCADIHLDTPFSSLGTLYGKSSIRRQDIKMTFETIIEMAYKEQVDFLFICGDLYEHNYIRKSTINFINDSFEKIKNTKVIMIPGNHDPWVKGAYYKSFNWADNVYILTDDRPYIGFEEEGVWVGQGDMFLLGQRDMQPVPLSNINFLLLHGSVDFDFNKNSYNPISSKTLALIGMDYIALGHFHNRIDKVAGLQNIYNPGSPEPLGFDETGKHGYFIGNISKDQFNNKKLEVKFISASRKEYVESEVNITDCTTDEGIIKKINDRLAQIVTNAESYSNLLASITLTGYISSQFTVDIEYITSYFNDKLFYIKIKNEAVPDYDFDEIKKEIGLKGLFVRKIFELIDTAKDREEKELLIKSLYYGVEAIEKGQVDISDY